MTKGVKDPHNEVGSMVKGKKKFTLKSLIHLVKDRVFSVFVRGPIELNFPAILTADLKKAIEDGSPTGTLLRFVEKGADVNVQAIGEFEMFCEQGIHP
jgi:hypothetical protein